MKKRWYAENVYYKSKGGIVERWIEIFHYKKHKYLFNEPINGATIVIAKTLKQAVDKYLSHDLDEPIDADILDLLTGVYSPDILRKDW